MEELYLLQIRMEAERKREGETRVEVQMFKERR